MAFAAIAFIAPNYRDFDTYWLKPYIPGGTTPKPLALESDGGTQVAKLELNADGFLKSAGGTLVIPYIDGAYDAWLFPTEAEADANNTTNAIRVADNIIGVSADSVALELINDLSQAYEFPTVAAYQAFTTAFPIGKVINTLEFSTGNGGGASYTVIASGTENTFNIIKNTTLSQSITLTIEDIVYPNQWGDTQAAWQAAIDTGKGVDFGSESYELITYFRLTNHEQDIFGQSARLSFSLSYDTEGDTLLQMFQVQGVDNVNIYGFFCDMEAPFWTPGIGLAYGISFLTGCDRGSVHHCTFRNQPLISLSSVSTRSGSTKIDVHNNIFYSTSEAYGGGAILHTGNRCLATNNICKNLGDASISLDDSHASICTNNIVINDLIVAGGDLRPVGDMMQIGHGSHGCIMSHNTITGVSVVGITVFDTVGNFPDHNIVANNTIDGGGVTSAVPTIMIQIDDSASNTLIHNNTLWNRSGGAGGTFGIRCFNRNNRVYNNDIDATGMTRGIQISFDPTDNEFIHVYDNTIKGGGQGIQFSAGDYNNTMQLHCYDNNIEGSTEGLKVDASNFLPQIYGNTFKDTGVKAAGTWQYSSLFNTFNSDSYPDFGIMANIIAYRTTMPSSGDWTANDLIKTTTQVIDGNQMLLQGWRRLTTGSGNVLNTDWAAQYISTVSPAT